MTTVLKLGGSVVTEKDSPETVDHVTLDEVAAAVGAGLETDDGTDLVVVHGGGSFGHHHAAAHEVTTTDGTHDATAVREIHGAMGALNEAVLDALSGHGVEAVPVHPLSVAHRNEDGELDLPAAGVDRMLREGFVPVLHGDVVAHEGKGATILSGDDIVVSLAQSLAADRVGLCSTVPGVLDEDGSVIPTVTAFEDVADALGGSDATDVTGGMAGKVRALLDLDVPASIFSPADLSVFLAGGTPGTVVRG
ncbi:MULTISPECIES: isopentenyl phosphate kinase [Salinibaculum]|uniref:isopentenyl phosphate kinase n=1 Tax=Salinibaculum TaxID=2732368 RepID=UPI0030D1B453